MFGSFVLPVEYYFGVFEKGVHFVKKRNNIGKTADFMVEQNCYRKNFNGFQIKLTVFLFINLFFVTDSAEGYNRRRRL